MPHVANIFGLLDSLQSADITVNQSRCAVVRNRNATCLRCADVCTSGCIAVADNELVITPDKCIGCATCATICPTCALEAHHPHDSELVVRCLCAAKNNNGECVIACEQILHAAQGRYDPEKVVSVTCIGRVEESLLTALAEQGISSVSLVKAKCAACEHVTGCQTAELVVETENVLLKAWNSTTSVVIVEKFPSSIRLEGEKDHDHERREFFSSLKGEAKSAAVKTTDFAIKDTLGIEEEKQPKYLKVMADGTLPHFIPDRRERLLDSLAALGTPREVMIKTRLFGHVTIDIDRCSSCQMCATFCPTGAIKKFKDEDGTFGIEHFPGDCVKCRCCTDICPEDALVVSDEVFAGDLLSGAVERYEMRPRPDAPGNPHQILNSMKNLLNVDQIYER